MVAFLCQYGGTIGLYMTSMISYIVLNKSIIILDSTNYYVLLFMSLIVGMNKYEMLFSYLIPIYFIIRT